MDVKGILHPEGLEALTFEPEVAVKAAAAILRAIVGNRRGGFSLGAAA